MEDTTTLRSPHGIIFRDLKVEKVGDILPSYYVRLFPYGNPTRIEFLYKNGWTPIKNG